MKIETDFIQGKNITEFNFIFLKIVRIYLILVKDEKICQDEKY